MQHCGIQIARITEETKEFLDMLAAWYFSGDWLEQNEDSMERSENTQLTATQEHAITHIKQKIEKWSALAKSCREGSCGALYTIQKLEMYQTILDALLRQKECALL